MDRKLRLLIVSDYTWPAGGIEQFVYELLSRASGDFDCTLLTWTESVLVPHGFTAVSAVQHGDVAMTWEIISSADIVLLVTSFNMRLLARSVTDYLNAHFIPVITVLQTSSHSIANSIARPSQAEWLKELVSSSQFVVAVSDDVVSSIYELQRSTGSNVNVVLIENGARLGVQDPGRRGRSTISFIGRPHVQKGFHFFERLASDFGQYGVQFNANTVSVPAERTCPGINYSYQLSDAELLSFYEQTDLLVVPYTHADGMPLAILEAINCGVPVLGFDSPGIAGLLRRYGQTLIEPSYQCLSDAVRGWISGQRSFPQPNAGAVPSWDAQVRQYVELIKRTEIRSSSGGVR